MTDPDFARAHAHSRAELGIAPPAEEHAALTEALAKERTYQRCLPQTLSTERAVAVLDVLIEELPEPIPHHEYEPPIGTACSCAIGCWDTHSVVRAARAAVGAS